jgi:hypothetical protein
MSAAAIYPRMSAQMSCFSSSLVYWLVSLIPFALLALLVRSHSSRRAWIVTWLFCFVPLGLLVAITARFF